MLKRLFGFGSAVQEMSVQEVHAQLREVNILDVRETSEYAEAHVSGSQLIPLGQLAQRMAEVPQDKPLVVVCRSGNRSSMAAQMLQQAGITCFNMQGGMLAWSRHGLPIERGSRGRR